MAILFEWYETPVPNNETDETEKTTIHARITLNGKVGTDEIRRKIQKRSSLTETDVSAVLDALSHVMGEELSEGRGFLNFTKTLAHNQLTFFQIFHICQFFLHKTSHRISHC